MSIPVAVGVAVIGTGLGLNPWTIGCGAAAMNFAAAQSGSGIKLQGDAGRLGNQRVEVLPKEVASNLRAEVVGTGNLYSAARAVKNLATGSLGLLLTVGTGGYAYKKSPVVKDMTKKLSSGVVDALQVIPGVGNQVAAVRNKRNFQQAVHLEKQEKEQEIVDLETKIVSLEKKVIKNDQDQILKEILQKLQYEKGESLRITDAELFYCLQFCERSNNFSCLKLIISKLSNNKDKERANKLTKNFKNWLNRVENRIKNLDLTGLIGEFASSRDLNYLGYVNKIWIENRTIRLSSQEESQLKDTLETAVLQSFDRQEKLNQELNDLKEKLYQKKLVNLYEDLVDKNRQYAAHAKQRPASFGIRHPLSYCAMARWNRREMQLKREMEQANKSFVANLKSEDLRRLGWVCDQEGLCCGKGNVSDLCNQERLCCEEGKIYVHREYLVQEAKKREQTGEQGLDPAEIGCRWDSSHTNQINISSGKAVHTVKTLLAISQDALRKGVWKQQDFLGKPLLIQREYDKILSQFTFRELLTLSAGCDQNGFCCLGEFKVPRENMMVFLNEKVVAKTGETLSKRQNQKNGKDADYTKALFHLKEALEKADSEYNNSDLNKPNQELFQDNEYENVFANWHKTHKNLERNLNEATRKLLVYLRDEDLEDLCSECDQNDYCCGGNLGLSVFRQDVLSFLSPPKVGYAKLSSGRVISSKKELDKIYGKRLSFLYQVMLEKTAQYEDLMKKPRRSRLFCTASKEEKIKEEKQNAILTLLRSLTNQEIEIVGSVCDKNGICYGGGAQFERELVEKIAKEKGLLLPASPGYRRGAKEGNILENEWKHLKDRVKKEVDALKAQHAYDAALKPKKKGFKLLFRSKNTNLLRADYYNKVQCFINKLTNDELFSLPLINEGNKRKKYFYDNKSGLRVPQEVLLAERARRETVK